MHDFVALLLPADHPAHRASPARITQALTLLDAVEARATFTEKRANAWHEGCHAIACLALGFPVHSVSIVEDTADGMAGVCVATIPKLAIADTAEQRLRLEQVLIVQLAGPTGQALAGFPQSDLAEQLHDLLGLQAARYFRPAMDEWEITHFVAWLRVRTRNLLLRAWPAAFALAYELLQARALSQEQILAIVQAAQPDFPAAVAGTPSPVGVTT